jgi:putative glutamine amidotransferase
MERNDSNVCSIEQAQKKEATSVVAVKKPLVPLEDLYATIYIVGDEPYGFPQLFARAACTKATSVDTADIVLFTGGVADVSPELYGQTPHRSTQSYPAADVRDIQTFIEAVELGVPMVGVCRGFQFLHVMNGGQLYQDVDEHNGDHSIFVRSTLNEIDKVSSVHHQLCKPDYSIGMEILAEAYEAYTKMINDTDKEESPSVPDYDVEAAWYPETCCLGVQGHPEYQGYEQYSAWFIKLIQDYIMYNPHIKPVNGLWRVSQEYRDRRKWKYPETIFPFLKEHG